jgi:hypothetical protein
MFILTFEDNRFILTGCDPGANVIAISFRGLPTLCAARGAAC